MSGVAAFDFDGTLCRFDSLLLFARYLRGEYIAARSLISTVPLLLFSNATVTSDAVKQRLCTEIFGGIDADVIDAAAQQFAGVALDKYMRDFALERLQWHQSQSHTTVIVSASPKVYLQYCADLLNISAVLATELEVVKGAYTGRLVGKNVRGPEKVEQLRSFVGTAEPETWAYGNSSGDRDMMDFVDHPFLRQGNRWVSGR